MSHFDFIPRPLAREILLRSNSYNLIKNHKNLLDHKFDRDLMDHFGLFNTLRAYFVGSNSDLLAIKYRLLDILPLVKGNKDDAVRVSLEMRDSECTLKLLRGEKLNLPHSIDYLVRTSDERGLRMLLKHNSINLRHIFKSAVERENWSVIHKFSSKNINLLMIYASSRGRVDIIDYAVKNGANQFNTSAFSAINNNRVEALKHLLKYNVDKEDLFVNNSFESIECLQCLLDAGAKNINDALVGAVRENRLHAVRFLAENGADDIERALSNWEGLNVFSKADEEVGDYLKSVWMKQ